MWKLATIAALFVTVVLSGCSEDKSSIDEAKDKAADVADDVLDAAGDMASGTLDQMKAHFETQLGGFDEQLASLKTAAEKFGDGDLNSYVAAIGARLGDAKKAMAEMMAGQDIDMGKIKEMMSTVVADLTGLFNAANDKVKSLES